ncbi:putative ribonuclease H protein [Acorus calamus]|uniref:Ribonuclease H protein n=1 Tax=Acorus calamus TaxID=4465 RepID=A0AAV9CLH9_ACOCL|nr:putative ribonuclease H protein [Acorus calamus]
MSYFPGMYHIALNQEGRAEEAWEGNGWRLRFQRAPTLAESTQATGLARMIASAPLVTGSSDRVRWGRRGHEEYTVRRGYRWWRRLASHRPEMVALQGLIWRSAAPLKIKIFVWLVGQERILTKVYCAKWNPDISTQCVLCNGGEETVDHLFRECMAARGLWLRLGARCNHRLNCPSMGEFWEATRKLTCRGDRSLESKVRRLVIPAGLWAIWLTRNSVIFRGQRFYMENLWDTAEGCIRDWGKFIVGANTIELHRGGHVDVGTG